MDDVVLKEVPSVVQTTNHNTDRVTAFVSSISCKDLFNNLFS